MYSSVPSFIAAAPYSHTFGHCLRHKSYLISETHGDTEDGRIGNDFSIREDNINNKSWSWGIDRAEGKRDGEEAFQH